MGVTKEDTSLFALHSKMRKYKDQGLGLRGHVCRIRV